MWITVNRNNSEFLWSLSWKSFVSWFLVPLHLFITTFSTSLRKNSDQMIFWKLEQSSTIISREDITYTHNFGSIASLFSSSEFLWAVYAILSPQWKRWHFYHLDFFRIFSLLHNKSCCGSFYFLILFWTFDRPSNLKICVLTWTI